MENQKFNIHDHVVIKWATHDSDTYESEFGVVVGFFIGTHNHLYYKIKTSEGIKEAPYYQVEESSSNMTPQEYLKRK